MRSIKSSQLFFGGLAIKVVLLFFFGSHYLRDLFIPFIDHAVQHPLANPWAQFTPEYFPYGSVLYALLFISKSIGFLIFGSAALGAAPISLAFIKLPLLIADVLLMWTLLQFTTQSIRPLLWAYWLNPALIFITYIHGQLDVVTTFFTLLALLLLARERIAWSAVAFAAATLCKFHSVVIFPFILVYLWKNDFEQIAIRKILTWGILWAALVVVGFLPALFAGNLLYVTFGSPQASLVFGTKIAVAPEKYFLIGVGLVVAILGRLCLSDRITARGLLFGAGIVFGTLLLITSPMPGWYYWVFPFLAIFYSTYYTNHRLVFRVLNVAFLLYFCLIEFAFPVSSPLWMSILFTLLQTTLAAALFEVWLLVISPEMPLQRSFKPLMIGIAGDSGVGKNKLGSTFADILGETNSVILEGDDYHKWERQSEQWELYTHINPRANHLPTLANHIMELMMGRFVLQPHYDHATGSFTLPKAIRPNKTIIIQGLHALFLRGMRNNLDLKIFIAADPLIQLAWKIKRDVKERGHAIEKVLDSIEKRSVDVATHIDPQRNVADWLIEYKVTGELTRDEVLAGAEPRWHVRFTLWNDAPWSEVIEALKATGACDVVVDEIPGDIDRVAITVHGNPNSAVIRHIAESIFMNIRHITRSRREPKWQGGLLGVCQLLTLSILQQKLINDSIYKTSN